MNKTRMEAFSDGVIAITAWMGEHHFVNPWLAFGLYVVVAVIWLIPDRRIERMMSDYAKNTGSD